MSTLNYSKLYCLETKQGAVTVNRLSDVNDPSGPYNPTICPPNLWASIISKVNLQVVTRAAVSGRAVMTVDNRKMYTGYAQYWQGVKPVIPSDRFYHKVKFKNPGWKPKDDTIVVGPYEVCDITIDEKVGELTETVEKLSTVPACFKSLGLSWTKQVGRRRFIDNSHFVFDETGLVFSLPQVNESGYYAYPSSLGMHWSAQQVHSILLGKFDIDSALVRETEADSNERYMDLLTNLAELPETVKMVMDGFKKVGSMYKAAKRREFSLSKGFSQRRAYLKKKLDESLASIDRRRKGASKRKLHILDREAKRARRTFSRALSKTLRELNDAIANVWMTYRYGIMPVVYSVEDVVRLIEDIDKEYMTSKEKEKFPVLLSPSPGWEGVPDIVDVTHRCWMKSLFRINVGELRSLRLVMANVMSTAWELVPGSFIVDWFIDVGNLLASLNPLPAYDQRVTTYSHRANTTFGYRHVKTGASIVIKIDCYKRQVINPDDHCGLAFKPEITLARMYDALALTWAGVRPYLSDSKRVKRF